MSPGLAVVTLRAMNWSAVRRAMLLVTLTSSVALLAAVWLMPIAPLAHVTTLIDPQVQVSAASYRAIISVAVAALAALVLLGAWSWSTRPDRPFELADGSELPVEAAADLVQRAVVTRRDVRTVEVAVEHYRSTLAVQLAIDVTANALIADVEERAREAATALASRVGLPLAAAEVIITFEELNLVAARARRRATQRARAA